MCIRDRSTPSLQLHDVTFDNKKRLLLLRLIVGMCTQGEFHDIIKYTFLSKQYIFVAYLWYRYIELILGLYQ